MNKTEAIKRIKDHIRVHHIGEYPHIKIAEALNMAISALETDSGEAVRHKEKQLLAVGDKVYQTDGVRIYESEIKKVIYCAGNIAFDKDAIGGSVFLSREEAEKDMERREKLG